MLKMPPGSFCVCWRLLLDWLCDTPTIVVVVVVVVGCRMRVLLGLKVRLVYMSEECVCV